MYQRYYSGFLPRLVLGAEHSLNLQRREETLHRRIFPALSTSAYAVGDALIDQQALEVLAAYWVNSTGRRNTFSQGGVYGTTCRVDAEVDGLRSDAFAGCL